MPQCSFCDEPAFYQCVWRMRRGGVIVPFSALYERDWQETLCMKLACYFHAIEVDEGRAVCCAHWHEMAGHAVTMTHPESVVRDADSNPDLYNPRRAKGASR